MGAACLKTPFECFREGEGPREGLIIFLLDKLKKKKKKALLISTRKRMKVIKASKVKP